MKVLLKLGVVGIFNKFLSVGICLVNGCLIINLLILFYC